MIRSLSQKRLRNILILLFFVLAQTTWAQLTLPSTSPYTQNFDAIGSGLPAGWTTRSGANASSQGADAGFSTGHVTWTSTTGGFRNSASSETSNAAGSTDRALSVRQTGSFGDPGAAFQLQIANTTGKTAFSLSMKHQILDSQPRSAIWNVQYSTNGTSWTSVGTAFSDPGAFGSTTGSYSFGTALDNKSAAVYIRVVTLAGTSGSGNRDTYGIDDFVLSWTNSVTAPTITGNNSQDFTYGIAGIYDFSATAGATINATLNPSGSLPTGITLDAANTEIEVASDVPAGTYTINISATNAGGTANKVVTLTVDPADQVITFGNITKVYGDTDFTLTATGGASGEAITYSSSDTAIADITGETVTILQPGTVTITATQAGNANYNPATATATLTIGLKPINITGASVNNKEYDSTNAAVITGAILNAAEIVGLDDVALDANYTATFDNANIGTGKPVTVIFTLTGAQANRYELTNPAGLSGDITAKELTITGLTANNKVYDGTTEATLNGTATLSGVIAGDDVTLDSAAADASFATETAGTTKPVSTTGYTITGANASNYTMEQPSFTADISAKQLTITGISIADKEFDGTTAATINGTAVLNGAISGDDVTLDATGAVAVFIEANTGALIPVTVSGYAVTGADAANYSLQQPQGLTANIIDVTLDDQTITFNALTSVTYGDAAFTLNATASSGLTVSYFSSDSTIASVTGNTVTILAAGEVTITAIQEGDAQYNPAPSVPQQLVINRKDLTVSGITVQDKTYNQTTVAVISGNLTGIVGADNVILSGAAQFADDNAGNNKSVTATFSITGTDADNYTLIQPTGITGNILPAELTLASADAQDKVYDGTATATITGTLNGILTGDAVTFNGTGTFADANVNTAIAVTSTSALTGTDAANYTLVQPTGLTADITAMGITVIANAEDKIYDKTTTVQITITQTNGVVSGDDVTVTGTGSFANFNVGTDKAVTANLTLTGADAANYTLTQPTGLTADITAKGLTIDVAGTVVNDKTYNGTVAATLGTTTLLGVIAGDEPNVTVASAEFSQENVGNNIAVSNFVLSGSASGNYTLTQPVGLTADITPAALTITNASAQNKVYDGTTAAVITGTLTGVVAGDVVAYTGTGTFVTENAGTGINVAASVTLTGTDAANYTITQPTGLTANITAKPLTVTATAQNKPYDSTVTAQVTNAAISGGIIIGDDVTLTATTVAGTFNNKSVGTNKPVSATFTLQGADAANYSVAAQAYTADITALSITADITAATVASKTYDGNTNATVSGVILTGVLAGDVVTANTGTFGNSNVGTNIPVTITLTGTDAGNYTLASNTGLSGNINKKILLATADDKTKTQGSNNPAFTISYSGFVTGETAANAAGFVVPQATTAAIASSPVGAYPITLTGGDALNYELILNNGWLIINPSGAATSAILAWDFSGENNVATSDAEIANVNLDSSITLGRGPGAPASVGSNSFRTQSFQNNGISTANTDYFQFVVSADPGYQVSLSTINASFNGTATYAAAPGVSHQFAYSLNGTNFTLINTPTVTVGNMSTISVTVSGVAALQNIPAGTTVTLRYYATGQTSTGGWGFYSSGSGSYGLSVNGSVIAAPQLPAITSTLTDASNIGSTDTYQITASGTPVISFAASNLPVGATIDENGLISFDGTTPAGAYNINLEAASFYGADTKTLVYTVNKLDQVLTLSPDPIPSKYDNAAPFTITATNSSALPVTWASSDTNVATVDAAGIVTIVGVGTTTITVSNAGNNTYNPVSETVTLTVLATPVIQATPNPIVLTAVQGQGPSASVQLATVTAQNLLPADGTITMTVSTGFEIATGVSAYTTTGSFTYTGGAVNSTNPLIYVRLAAGHTAGTYTGTLTIEGGDASVQIPLNATVEIAPAITTTAAAYGPYCEASQNTISVAYTTEGNFPSGSYYVQLSNASGVFASDFSNIISSPATASPISATLPELTAGSYRVRVVHLATSLSLTTSGNNNGTDIQINALPTLSGVTTVSACNGNDAQITLNGLLASTAFTATYTVNGETAQQVQITSNASGQATFTLPVTGANNGHAVVITQLTTGLPLACAATFTSGNTTNLIVTPAPLAGSLTLCTGATVAELTATGTDLKWYADATTTTELEDTAVLTTANYFVSQTLGGCESARRLVAVTINTTPAPTAGALTFCTGATAVELTATGTDLKWYADATTTTEVEDTAVLTTGNYFVSQTLNSCESTRTQVAVTVNTTPAPTAGALTFCAGTTAVELTATGTDLKWYADATTTTELEDTVLLTTSNYFVSQTLNNCESTRIQVAVTINTTPAPTANALTFCAGATAVELTATGIELKWYADATTSTELEDTAVLTTGNYFVSQTLNSCEGTRAQVAVTINTTPAPTADALSFCPGATAVELTATGTDLKWYADATTTTEIEDTVLLTTGNYFVSQTLNNCESTRTQVAVTINTTPAPTADALTFCTSATAAELTATGTDLKWYADATTTTELEDTAVLTNGNYFVSQTLNGCESTRTQVAVTITILDAPDAQEEQDFTTGETLENLEVLGDNLQWYSDEVLTVAIPSTTELVDGTTYYVVQTQGECMSEATAITVSEELDVTDFNKGEFVYYPNPVKDILNIDYTQNILQVNIYDLTGKNVMTVTPNSMNAKINMAQLQEGTYILNVATESQSKTIRVIKH